MLEFFKKTGAEGGRKRAANLSKDELAAIGRKGAEARWGKPRAKKAAAASAKVRSAAAKKKAKAKRKSE